MSLSDQSRLSCWSQVQSLNYSFSPRLTGAEQRVQDSFHAHAQNAAIPPPPLQKKNRGKSHIWKYFLDLACGAIF